MPTPRKRSASYPSEYTLAFETARLRGFLSIRMKSAIEARRLRDHLYAFRSTVVDDPRADRNLVEHIRDARMKLDGKYLVIYYPEQTTIQELQDAINDARLADAETGSECSTA